MLINKGKEVGQSIFQSMLPNLWLTVSQTILYQGNIKFHDLAQSDILIF